MIEKQAVLKVFPLYSFIDIEIFIIYYRKIRKLVCAILI